MIGVQMKLEGLEEAKKMLSSKKIKYALLNTINNTARLDVADDLRGEMKRVFDRLMKNASVTGRREGTSAGRAGIYAFPTRDFERSLNLRP